MSLRRSRSVQHPFLVRLHPYPYGNDPRLSRLPLLPVRLPPRAFRRTSAVHSGDSNMRSPPALLPGDTYENPEMPRGHEDGLP